MSEKRRDNKNRILRTGESQRSDGRYEYKYTDILGKRKSVYSWRLVSTDKNPSGRRSKFSLRELEEQILNNNKDGIRTDLSKTTVAELAKVYLDDLTVKASTVKSYEYCVERYIIPYLGHMLVKNVSEHNVKQFYKYLSEKRYLKESTITSIASNLNKILNFAIKLRIIKENPAKDILKDFRNSLIKSPPRKALTKDQQRKMLDILDESKTFQFYKPMLIAFLDTGGRASEITGLQWSDIDFTKNEILIRQSLHYLRKRGQKRCAFYIDTTKNGKERVIPLTTRLRDVLLERYLLYIKSEKSGPDVDGYNEFVFLNKKGEPICNSLLRYIFKEIEKRFDDNVILSPHILRHTFCTRLCEVETNIKVIQELMGHSNYQITMRIYAEAQSDSKRKTLEKYDSLIEEEAI